MYKQFYKKLNNIRNLFKQFYKKIFFHQLKYFLKNFKIKVQIILSENFFLRELQLTTLKKAYHFHQVTHPLDPDLDYLTNSDSAI